MTSSSISRRRLLAGLAATGAGLALPEPAAAFGKSALLDVCELDLGQGTTTRPNAWKRLLYETKQTTSVECANRAVQLAPDDVELFEHPFAVLLGTGAFAELSNRSVEQLSRYLAYGGFLFIDDTTGSPESPFDTSVRRLVSRLFPTRPLSRLPDDHSVYRSFFLIREKGGRTARFDYFEGVTVGNLAPIVYSRNDVSGALERADNGRFVYPCVPGGERQRRGALKFGMNLILYSLTANYKKDQAHVSELMRDGRREWFE